MSVSTCRREMNRMHAARKTAQITSASGAPSRRLLDDRHLRPVALAVRGVDLGDPLAVADDPHPLQQLAIGRVARLQDELPVASVPDGVTSKMRRRAAPSPDSVARILSANTPISGCSCMR